MTRYKKIIIVIVLIIALIVSGLMIYNINTIFPPTEDKAYRTGEEARYKGLKITVGDMKMYSSEEFKEQYPDMLDMNEMFGAEIETIEENYIIADITIENDTDEKISLSGKINTIIYWVAEVGMAGNGMDGVLFSQLNPDYDGTFAAGEKQDIVLTFTIPENWIAYEELHKQDVKIVFSYYPTKSYIFYEGER